MNIQFKKGVLELCVLSVLVRKDCYGYELVQKISRNIDISEGTIYPLLRRLKSDGYVTAYLEESSEGPPRKYYQLTELGKSTLTTLAQEWADFVTRVNRVVKGGAEDD